MMLKGSKGKYLAIIIILCFGTLIFLFGCFVRVKVDTPLKHRIIEVVEESQMIDFRELTNFNWDEMYVFMPYANPKDILKKDGIKVGLGDFSIELLDTIIMIGFVGEKRLITYVELPIDIKKEEFNQTVKKYTREEGKFVITQDYKIIFH